MLLKIYRCDCCEYSFQCPQEETIRSLDYMVRALDSGEPLLNWNFPHLCQECYNTLYRAIETKKESLAMELSSITYELARAGREKINAR